MSERDVFTEPSGRSSARPRRMRYRVGPAPWPELVSRTLARRVLYGALFFYLAYAAHLYAFVRSEVESVSPPPVLQASALRGADVAPVESGVLEPILARLVRGASDSAMVTSGGRSGT